MAEKLSRTKAMAMKCAECMGYYEDEGKVDCTIIGCPLYPWYPYAEHEPNLEWTKYNPKRVGKVLLEESKRTMTEEQRAAAAERLSKARLIRSLAEDEDEDEEDDGGDETA
jgi:hypothetical protein